LASILIKSAKILQKDHLVDANILIRDGTIQKISRQVPSQRAGETIEASGLIALPGLIDPHVHLRDLDLSYKETFKSGTQAAAAGGVTTVLDMPNSKPPTASSETLKERSTKATGSVYSNVGFQGALIDDPNEINRMAADGALAFKLYLNKSLETFDYSDSEKLVAAMTAVRGSQSILTVHAEDGVSIRKIQLQLRKEGRTKIADFLKTHNPSTEVTAVDTILRLAHGVKVQVHICHITTGEAVKLVRKTPRASCEATPHHLLLNTSAFQRHGPLAICVPPLRSEAYRRGLWREFIRGSIALATDHAPHTLAEKTADNVWDVAPGVPGLETTLPVMFTQVRRGTLSLRRLVEAAASIPARIFGLKKKGFLREGLDADIVLVDPKAKVTIRAENFLSKARYTPFEGMKCTGQAAYTIVNGELVAERGKIVGPPAGRVVKR